MFKKKSFVFIGRFKKKNKQTKKQYKKLVEVHGGKHVTSISNKTDYVIFPKKITEDERNNKQIKKLKNIYNNSIEFIYCNWLEDCIKKKKIIPISSKYKVEEFYKLVLPFKNFFNVNLMPEPFYKDMITEDYKIYKEFINEEGDIFFYNTLNGRTTLNPCNDFMDRLLGDKSILRNDYFANESTVLEIEKNLNKNITDFKESINVLNKYEKNLRKRLRSEDFGRENLEEKKRKLFL